MRRAGWPYVLLRPPAVSRPLLVLADQTRAPGLDVEFRAWGATPAAAVLDAGAVRAKVRGELATGVQLPGREDLLRCKWFAEAAGTPVAMYAAETFGGAVEYEWAWLFAPGTERALVLTRRDHDVRFVRRRWLLFRRTITRHVINLVALEITQDASAERPYPHPLAIFDHVADHLGIELPGGAFTPHLRGFDSGPYHVLPPRRRSGA